MFGFGCGRTARSPRRRPTTVAYDTVLSLRQLRKRLNTKILCQTGTLLAELYVISNNQEVVVVVVVLLHVMVIMLIVVVIIIIAIIVVIVVVVIIILVIVVIVVVVVKKNNNKNNSNSSSSSNNSSSTSSTSSRINNIIRNSSNRNSIGRRITLPVDWKKMLCTSLALARAPQVVAERRLLKKPIKQKELQTPSEYHAVVTRTGEEKLIDHAVHNKFKYIYTGELKGELRWGFCLRLLQRVLERGSGGGLRACLRKLKKT